jgi:tetratricopeptide (TPR) repeat protein
MSKPLKGFITYSHKNRKAKDQLIECLDGMKCEGKIKTWHDNEIIPGDVWRDAIFSNLADSDILLYLVSTASLASENCKKELAEALGAKIRVIPIILERCDWLNDQLSDFQALPDGGKPINEWQLESVGWQNVVDGIRKAVDVMQSQVPLPDLAPENIEILAYVALQRGNFLQMLRQIDRAIEAYSRAIELNPNYTDAYNNRGVSYSDKEEYGLAIKDFNTAIELCANNTVFYSNRGATYSDMKNYDRAIEDHNKAIELEPDFAVAYYNRGEAYSNKGEVDHAIEDYNKAIELDPDYIEAYGNRGVAYHNKGEVDCAIENYNKAIELEPDSAHNYINRGAAHRKKGDNNRSIVDYNKAIKLDCNNAIAYYNRGVAYFIKNAVDHAIKDYTKAIQLNPDYARAYNNRGVAWLRLGEWDKARADLKDAKNMGVYTIAAFRYFYESVSDFEAKHSVQLPPDIAAMLTPQ